MSPDKGRRARPRRGAGPTRQRRPREVEQVVYVVCEGEVTEYEYLAMINNRFGDQRFWLDFPPQRERRKGLSPRQVVDRALVAGDEKQVAAVWALFDRDQHPEIPEAFGDADGHDKVHIAFSNPSFDLWLLLHFQPYPAQAHGSSSEVHAKLRSHAPFHGFGDRDKHVTQVRAAALAPQLGTAVRHARALVNACPTEGCSAHNGHASRCHPLNRDPSTDVYLLIESLGIVPRRGRG